MADLLIIDDDAPAADALAALLRREGHTVECAATTHAGLTALHRAEPDLVLLDLAMPGVDGLSLLDALRDDPRFCDLRIAILSGHTEPEAVAAAERLGVVDFIAKGGDWNALHRRIKAALSEPAPSL